MIELAEFSQRQAVSDAERVLLAGGFSGEIIGPYVYAMLLRNGAVIEPLPINDRRLLYIGKTDGFAQRDHLLYRSSSQSAPRRTLGALLRWHLGLTAFPRGRALKQRDIDHFNFGDGEPRLTAWMREHLVIARAPVAAPARAIEKALIFRLQPSINLTDWKNPHVSMIREFKRACRDEAAARRDDCLSP
jgi:hypothetical protein